MRKVTLLGFLFLIISTGNISASSMYASRTINYQGRLTDNNNNSVLDGNYIITFRLYDDPNAVINKNVWYETHTDIATKSGYFNVVLGGITPFNKNGLDFNNQYWVGVQVGSDSEMSPRQALNGVPMTLNYDLPVGSIIAWHRDMPNTPALSPQWRECDGSKIGDNESPYVNLNLPDLNHDGRFLRGTGTNSNTVTTSGQPQTDQVGSHTHPYVAAITTNVSPNGWIGHGVDYVVPDNNLFTQPNNSVGSETRPINMSVVWIMKIK